MTFLDSENKQSPNNSVVRVSLLKIIVVTNEYIPSEKKRHEY